MSAGALAPLRCILQALPKHFPGALVLAQHLAGPTLLPTFIAAWTEQEVTLARTGMGLREGVVYICPAQKHLIVNADATLTVSSKERVEYVRPSIDWLMDSAAAVYRERATAVLLSGSNADGTRGAACVARQGGLVIVQRPDTCEFPEMPSCAMHVAPGTLVLDPESIAAALLERWEKLSQHSAVDWADPFAAD
jgi:two-component system chemotaxis response regulator CheB